MTTQTSTLTPAAAARQSRLAEQVSRIRTSAAAGRLDRWLLIVGGTLAPLGVLAIILGWLGASHTVLVFEQIPYLISGGLLGLSLAILGGLVYFAYWMTLLVREGRAQHTELVTSLGRIERLLAGQGEAEVPVGSFVATSGGAMMHRADCPIVGGRNDLREVSESDGLQPCRICNPLD
jgi:hypothetical protein